MVTRCGHFGYFPKTRILRSHPFPLSELAILRMETAPLHQGMPPQIIKGSCLHRTECNVMASARHCFMQYSKAPELLREIAIRKRPTAPPKQHRPKRPSTCHVYMLHFDLFNKRHCLTCEGTKAMCSDWHADERDSPRYIMLCTRSFDQVLCNQTRLPVSNSMHVL